MNRHIIFVFLFVLNICNNIVKAEPLRSEQEIKIEVKILEKISVDIVKKNPVKVYVIGYNKNYLKKYAKKLLVVENCNEADIIIAKENNEQLKNTCKKKIPGIALNYLLLKENPNFIGALFWYKGRPNLVFISFRLEKFKIKLPKSYGRYIEEKIW
ncbi:MAG: hypothetical protein GXO22_08155 [Aquificae bacterium]|nr:hypothetical protein [Aquificota bacterium]